MGQWCIHEPPSSKIKIGKRTLARITWWVSLMVVLIIDNLWARIFNSCHSRQIWNQTNIVSWSNGIRSKACKFTKRFIYLSMCSRPKSILEDLLKETMGKRLSTQNEENKSPGKCAFKITWTKIIYWLTKHIHYVPIIWNQIILTSDKMQLMHLVKLPMELKITWNK